MTKLTVILTILHYTVTIIVISISNGVKCSLWDYSDDNGPSNWGSIDKSYEICSRGEKQSPLNIMSNETEFNFHILKLQNHDNVVSGTLINTENTLRFLPDEDDVPTAWVVLGFFKVYNDLYRTYKLHQFHFHWGAEDGYGSEHSIDGRHSEGELHFVYYNAKFKNFSEALGEDDGVVVIGFLLHKGNSSVQTINQMFNGISDNHNDDSNIKEYYRLQVILSDIFSDEFDEFYTYEGSLTTPPCTQNVAWIIAKNYLTITEEHLVFLRGQRDASGNNMTENFRPTQPQYGRKIERSFTSSGVTMPVSHGYYQIIAVIIILYVCDVLFSYDKMCTN